MTDICEKCQYFYKTKKDIRGIDGKISDIVQYKCRLGHKIVKSIDGWVPRTRGYCCEDFNKSDKTT